MSNITKILLSSLAVLAVCCGPAKAGIIYNNLAPGGGNESSDKTFASISRWGQQFTASSGGTVANLKLNLYRQNEPSQSLTFDVQLWSGSGTTPIASLATLKTLNWEDVPLNSTATNTSDFIEITSFAENYNLVSGTTYWLVVSQATNGPQAKRWSVTGSGGQTASFNANTGTWTNRGTDVNLGAQISIVPEPSALPMVVLALIGLACANPRRARARVPNRISC